jgi:hypothetical protein
MIVSRCCHAEVIAASAIYSAQLYDDWYECSQCERVCATMQINITNRDVEDE